MALFAKMNQLAKTISQQPNQQTDKKMDEKAMVNFMTTLRKKQKIQAEYVYSDQQPDEKILAQISSQLSKQFLDLEVPSTNPEFTGFDDPSVDRPYLQFFSVIKPLGRGGFSTVYLVSRRGDGQKFALKEIQIHKDNPEHKLTIQKEIDAQRTLSNIHVIKLMTTFETQTHIFMLMELASGGDLDQFINSQQNLLDANCIYLLLAQLVVTLDFMHSKNIAHHDIKPANIFINELKDNASLFRHFLQIGDFGLVTSQQHDHQLNDENYGGTYPYMPPEKLNMLPFDAYKADSWALGIILYQLCTKKLHVRNMKEIRLIQNSKNNLSENYNVGEEYQKFEFQEIFDCLTKYDFNERLSVHDLITTSKQRFKKLYSFIQLVINIDSVE